MTIISKTKASIGGDGTPQMNLNDVLIALKSHKALSETRLGR